MTDRPALPPSLAVTPNIPLAKQTLEHARAIQAEINRRQKP